MKTEQFIISFFPIVLFFSMLFIFQALRGWRRAKSSNTFHVMTIMGGPDRAGAGAKMEASNRSGDRRAFPRVAFNGFVDFVYRGALVKTMSRDLSRAGMFIRVAGSGRFKRDNDITLTFQQRDGRPFKSRARIARIDDDGIGVVFMAA